MEVVVIAGMLAVNAVFAAYEMALASVSRARLEVLHQEKRRGASFAIYMKERLEGSLAVIQLGITLAGAIAAATGGAAVDEQLSPWIAARFGLSVGTSDFLALVIFVIPLSAITIIFAELVPKMVGIRNKEGVVLALSPVMRVVGGLFSPAVLVFEWVVKRLVSIGEGRWKGAGKPEDHAGLMELRAAASLARATRIIGAIEERIVVSAAQLSMRSVADAMVPASEISAVPAGSSMEEALVEAHMHMHTRYPVCKVPGDPQTISGYVTFKDIVTSLRVSAGTPGLQAIIRPLHRIPVTTPLSQALTEMIRDHVHIALATDGSAVKGLITMEDIVEELEGDIHDEYDRLPGHLTVIGEGWLVGGGVTIADLAKAMGGSALTGVNGHLSVAEWVAGVRTTPPASGDIIRANDMLVMVRKVRRNLVSEAIVRTAPGAAANALSHPQ